MLTMVADQPEQQVQTVCLASIIMGRFCLSSFELVCRYGYHEGLLGGVADLIGRDQAIAKTLAGVHHSTGLKVYLAFVTMKVSGKKPNLTYAHLPLLLSFIHIQAGTHKAYLCILGM